MTKMPDVSIACAASPVGRISRISSILDSGGGAVRADAVAQSALSVDQSGPRMPAHIQIDEEFRSSVYVTSITIDAKNFISNRFKGSLCSRNLKRRLHEKICEVPAGLIAGTSRPSTRLFGVD
jgi:hypothetical protein